MKKDKLESEIRFELAQMDELSATAEELHAMAPHERRPWDSAAAAKFVADIAAGLENLCKSRYRYLGISTPSGQDSHMQILNDFFSAEGLGKNLSEEMELRIKKYLRFRHRFVHGYGFQINWEIVEEPLRLLPDTVKTLKRIWENWLSSLLND